jgi:hypothetical protein
MSKILWRWFCKLLDLRVQKIVNFLEYIFVIENSTKLQKTIFEMRNLVK